MLFLIQNYGIIARRKKITELYFCGVWSGVCVYHSAVDAAYRRIWPILVTDASAGQTKTVHKNDCKRFAQEVGKIISTKEILENL